MAAPRVELIQIERLLARDGDSDFEQPRYEPTPDRQQQKRQKPRAVGSEIGNPVSRP